MINDLQEKEILDYIMTSDFTEGLTPDEFTFLLIRLRNYYRISTGKNEHLKSELDIKKKEISELKDEHSSIINKIMMEKAEVEDKLSSISNKKLSFKERITGRIIPQKN